MFAPAIVPCFILVGSASALDFEWGAFDNVAYDWSGATMLGGFQMFTGWDFAEKYVGNLEACEEFCEEEVGCNFVVYTNGACKVKLVDQVKYTRTVFKGQINDNFVPGVIRNVDAVGTNDGVASTAACMALCDDNAQCQFATYATSKNQCEMNKFKGGGSTISFRLNPRALNDRPATEGTFATAGNTGIVAIAAGLLPNGKILLGARPEYERDGPNPDNQLAGSPTASGEIASLYDPTTESSVPIRVSDNLFCHGQVLTTEGDMFTAGGDADSYDGLVSALDKQRTFVTSTSTYKYGKTMQRTRWYPTVVRTTLGTYWIIGGQVTGEAYELNENMEIFTPGLEDVPNELVGLDLIARTHQTNYPKPVIIPGSGNVYMFQENMWSVLDKNNGAEIEVNAEVSEGLRGGDYGAAAAILPMAATASAANHVCEFILFGGGSGNFHNDPEVTEDTIATVARMVVSNANKQWTYDEPMPYGRVVSDAVVQPNGKILIFNGGRHGRSGGWIGQPIMFGTASEVFCYDPAKPFGQRWEVLAKSPNRRFYHSTVVLVPDGTSIVMGTDEATYDPTTAYDHEAERFTPPWLLDGSPRPVITGSPDAVPFNTKFTIEYTGPMVDKVTLMAPNSNTHGTEMTQRTLFLMIVENTGTSITVKSPVDATVMIEGHYMLFAVAGDTPSVAQWVQISGERKLSLRRAS